jgi:protease I
MMKRIIVTALVLAMIPLCLDVQAAEKELAGKSVCMIIARKNFRDEELLEPAKLLKEKGAKVVIASSTKRIAVGMLGAKVKPQLLLSKVKVEKFDAIVFIGGLGAQEYFKSKTALKIAREAVKKKKILGAICIAPSILANAGVLKGRRATAFKSQKAHLEACGAKWSQSMVIRDGNIITACGPEAAKHFGQSLARALAQKK